MQWNKAKRAGWCGDEDAGGGIKILGITNFRGGDEG